MAEPIEAECGVVITLELFPVISIHSAGKEVGHSAAVLYKPAAAVWLACILLLHLCVCVCVLQRRHRH